MGHVLSQEFGSHCNQCKSMQFFLQKKYQKVHLSTLFTKRNTTFHGAFLLRLSVAKWVGFSGLIQRTYFADFIHGFVHGVNKHCSVRPCKEPQPSDPDFGLSVSDLFGICHEENVRRLPKLLRGIYRSGLTWKDQIWGHKLEVIYMDEPCNAC